MSRILIERHYGGFGDLLMLSRGLDRLISDGNEVGLVLDRKWHPLFEGWHNIEMMEQRRGIWNTIINFHNPCPAGFVESRHVNQMKTIEGRTHVHDDRVSIFAKAMGIALKPEERTPHVVLRESDKRHASDLMRSLCPPSSKNDPLVIYVQTQCAESYRDWPFMHRLADEMAKDHHVIQQCSQRGFCAPLLTSIALMAECDLIITPDSFALHASAAVGVRCLAIFGPTGAETRIKHYPFASAVTLDLPCVPCWRNQHLSCEYGGDSVSQCLKHLSFEDVLQACHKRLDDVRNARMIPDVKYQAIAAAT